MSDSTEKVSPHMALQVDNLSKQFGAVQALDNVNFTVPEASLTVILGPAGAGKTTTLRLIAGLDQPDLGRVVLGGEDVGRWEPKDRNVAMILDTLALYPNKSGFENLASPLRIRGESQDVIEEKVYTIAKTLTVMHLLSRLPKTMSGGERQRIALGRALIRTPKLFLLDEPLSSLDAMLRIELRAVLKRLQREMGYTFLMATPDFHEALAVADTVIMLREGRIVQVDKPQNIYDFPADREVASFVGAPQINLLEATLQSGDISFAGTKIQAPAHFADFLLEGRSFEMGVRPENLILAAPEKACIKGALIDVEPLGLKSVLTVQNDAADVRVLVDSAEAKGLSEKQNVGLDIVAHSKILPFNKYDGYRIVDKEPDLDFFHPDYKAY